jgi:kynureninase
MTFQNTLEFAHQLDAKDPLRLFKERFYFPTFLDKEVRYFTGNSLGLQPKSVRSYIEQELNDWAKYGVEGHFLAERPWFSYHEQLTEKAANVVGALPIEVVITHSLTTLAVNGYFSNNSIPDIIVHLQFLLILYVSPATSHAHNHIH